MPGMRKTIVAVMVWLVPVSAAPFVAAQQTATPATQAAVPFENEIKAYEQADKTNPPPREANLFVGSSSIRLWKTMAEDLPGKNVINRGFGGSQIADSVRFADRIVIPYHPARIFFYAGDNDLNAGKSPETVAGDFAAFEKKVHAALPDVDIYFISAKPSPSRAKIVDKDRELNRLIVQYSHDHSHIGYVDVFTPMLKDGQMRPELFVTDMLHMNHQGYEIWAKLIAPLLK